MSSTLEDSMKTATKVVDEVKEAAGKTAHRAGSRAVGGLTAAASVITLLRGLGIGDALGWVGLERRRSPARSMAMFGAGVLAGAAAGLLLAPRTGAATRQWIAERATDIGRKTEKGITRGTEQAAAKAKEIAAKIESNGHNHADPAKRKPPSGSPSAV